MKAVIMAGGKGTRLRQIASDIPKPMFRILGHPILEYQIESLKKSGIYEIVLIIGHLGNIIRNYFGDGSNFGAKIRYINEGTPLGTAGALYYLKDTVKEDFLLIFGDLLLDVDWNRFMQFHQSKSASATLYGHPNSHPYDSDLIIVDHEDRVIRIESKNLERDFYYHNFVNAGIYCISPRLLDMLSAPRKMDLEKELIAGQIGMGNIYAYRSTEYVKDMGTPDRLMTVLEDIKRGVLAGRSLKEKQKAIFLDRDGTINVLKGFLNNADDFELLPTAASAIYCINCSEYLAIVVTNQPVIARGECTFEELERIHKKMETLLGVKGAYIDDLFFCPHHPDRGFPGELLELKKDCDCRKPKIGLLRQAAERYNIDLTQSWYVGDSTVDIQTGKNAGMKTVLVKTGEGGKDAKFSVRADFEAENLLEAVKLIL